MLSTKKLLYKMLHSFTTNKVLWSGVWIGGGNQTMPLSEPISKQPHGVVLAFSAYESGTAKDYDWQYFFVPKWHVINYGSTGIDFFLSTKNQASSKYLYINDTSISGSTGNGDTNTGATSKIVLTNGNFVLRAVIGV